MFDTSSGPRIGKHVHHGSARIRYRQFLFLLPHDLRTELIIGCDVRHYEGDIMDELMTFRDGPYREDTDVPENLLGQVPVLSSRPATDICWTKEVWNYDPGII